MKKELILTKNVPDFRSCSSSIEFMKEISKFIIESQKLIREEKKRYSGYFITISGVYDNCLELKSSSRFTEELLKFLGKKEEFPLGIDVNDTNVPLLLLYSKDPMFKRYCSFSTIEKKENPKYYFDKECEVYLYGIVSKKYEIIQKFKNAFKINKKKGVEKYTNE